MPELLAPAGDPEKLAYALAYGADGVYLSGSAFGMRAFAGNFTDAEMKDALALVHSLGKKAYVTVNVMPHPEEMKALPTYLDRLAALEPDALIVSDPGVFSLCRKHAPAIPLHISTQAGTVNAEGARFWHSLGAARIVLARELTLLDIADIRTNTPKDLALEAFVHGAMCVSYSGRCLISNYLAGRDANLGACAQPCRWRYHLVEETRPGQYMPVEEDERGTYLYNAKDLCLIEHIPDLIRAGVGAFKIEGRAKTAFYAAGITGAYRRAIDAYAKNPENPALPPEVLEEVYKVSHRNYSKGFAFGRDASGEHTEDSHYVRLFDVCAQFVRMEGEDAVFVLKNRMALGDEIELMQPQKAPLRFALSAMKGEEGKSLLEAVHPMMKVKIPFGFEVAPYAMLRRKRREAERSKKCLDK